MSANEFDTVVRGGLVVTSSAVTATSIGIRDGQIASMDAGEASAEVTIDVAGKYVFPGLIDAHNHPVYADDIEAYSAQVALGGFTTLIPFMGAVPAWGRTGELVPVVDDFVREGTATSHLDFAVHATIRPDTDVASDIPVLTQRGIRSAKMFTCSGKGDMYLTDEQILSAMAILAQHSCVAAVHAENQAITTYLEKAAIAVGRTQPGQYAAARPPIAEAEAVFRVLSLAESVGCSTYLVHLSSSESLDVVRWFRRRNGPPIYAEVCTHHLVLGTEDLIAQGPLLKISPPLREQSHRDSLWAAIADGTVDTIATDGSGQTMRAKMRGADNIFHAPGGIPGGQFMLPLLLTDGVNRNRISVQDVARTCAENPARAFGLFPRKGTIAVGSDADIVVVDPALPTRATVADMLGNSDYCPYEGRDLIGRPTLSLQRGQLVLEDGKLRAQPGQGKFVPMHVTHPTNA